MWGLSEKISGRCAKQKMRSVLWPRGESYADTDWKLRRRVFKFEITLPLATSMATLWLVSFNLKTSLENTICHICACDSKGTNTILKGNKCVPCPEDKKAVQIFPEHGNNEHRSTPIYKCVKCNGGTVTDKGRDLRTKTFGPTATGPFFPDFIVTKP